MKSCHETPLYHLNDWYIQLPVHDGDFTIMGKDPQGNHVKGQVANHLFYYPVLREGETIMGRRAFYILGTPGK